MRNTYSLDLRRGKLQLGQRTIVMGVLNITPDSFSDGGLYYSPEKAFVRALAIEAEGADILDIGGESTRPSGRDYGEGERSISAEEEISRVLPVIEALRGRLRIPISIDTYKAETARVALKAGAEIINDISGLKFDPSLAQVAAEFDAPLVLMHTRGRPEVMQKLPPSPDILAEIEQSLKDSIAEAMRAGVRREQIILDPGIGFGKTVAQNYLLIDKLDRLAKFNLPLLVGPSRKSFLSRSVEPRTGDSKLATAVAAAACVLRGADIVRVHDVKDIREACAIADSIRDSDKIISW